MPSEGVLAAFLSFKTLLLQSSCYLLFILFVYMSVFLCTEKQKDMKDTSSHITVQFLTETYTTYRPLVFRYISYKLNGCLEAEDLVQDAFLRLLEYRSMLRPETIRSFLYTIVRNIVIDYLRHQYKKQEVLSSLQDEISNSVCDIENTIIARDIRHLELSVVNRLSGRNKVVYYKSHFEEKTVSEIAVELNLSKRTVEGYLLSGRKVIREYIKQCI